MAVSFATEISRLDGLATLASSAIRSVEELPQAMEEPLIYRAREELLGATKRAISGKREFNRSQLSKALLEYFSQPERLSIIWGGEYPTFLINVPNADSMRKAWDEARKTALTLLNLEERGHSSEWKQRYWRQHVWAHKPTYDRTINLRLSITEHTDDPAPFWGFLELGGDAGAHPIYMGTNFVARTQARLGNPNFSKKFIKRVYARVAGEINDVLQKVVVDGKTVGMKQKIKHSTTEAAIVVIRGAGGQFASKLPAGEIIE